MSTRGLPQWSRRSMLLGVTGGLAVGYGAVVGLGATQGCVPDDGEMATAERMGMVSLGATYLAQAAADERAALFAMAARPPAIVAELAATMSAQAEAEFGEGTTVSCDGWVLARGEARACALIALQHARWNGIAPLG
jgi:hypothetical protein